MTMVTDIAIGILGRMIDRELLKAAHFRLTKNWYTCNDFPVRIRISTPKKGGGTCRLDGREWMMDIRVRNFDLLRGFQTRGNYDRMVEDILLLGLAV